jgi:hypothetical protein
MASIPNIKINNKHIASITGNNILDTYNLATTEEVRLGKEWYKTANYECSALLYGLRLQDYSLATIVGMTAALSPRNKWARNLIDVDKLLDDDNTTVGTFHANKAKALSIKHSFYSTPWEIENLLGGDKVKSFYRNILEPENTRYVTVDGHAIGVWLGCRTVSASAQGNAYQTIKDAYVTTANELCLIPCELQAITWLTYRRIYGIK